MCSGFRNWGQFVAAVAGVALSQRLAKLLQAVLWALQVAGIVGDGFKAHVHVFALHLEAVGQALHEGGRHVVHGGNPHFPCGAFDGWHVVGVGVTHDDLYGFEEFAHFAKNLRSVGGG